MTLDDILHDIHVLEQDLQTYERKYGVLSETFYESYMKGEEPADDAWVMDWSAWAGTYDLHFNPSFLYDHTGFRVCMFLASPLRVNDPPGLREL